MSFIKELLGLTPSHSVAELPAFIYDDETLTKELAANVLPPREVLAVEHAHGVVTRALDNFREEEQRLVDEINERTEKLRQVRVTLEAMTGAYNILNADMNRPASVPPMPQIT